MQFANPLIEKIGKLDVAGRSDVQRRGKTDLCGGGDAFITAEAIMSGARDSGNDAAAVHLANAAVA